MNKELIIRRFAKASESYEREATVQRQIAAFMITLLEDFTSSEKCRNILEIGCGTGIFSRMLIELLKPGHFTLNDICPQMYNQLKDIISERIHFKAGDAETGIFTGEYDLIASCSAIQWFKNPEVFFNRMHSLLTKEGIFAFSTFGKDNMKEIAMLTGEGLHYFSGKELINMLNSKYHILHFSEKKLQKRFANPKEVLYHLKRTGVTGITQRKWTRNELTSFCDRYGKQYSSDGNVILTYHPVYIVTCKKGN